MAKIHEKIRKKEKRKRKKKKEKKKEKSKEKRFVYRSIASCSVVKTPLSEKKFLMLSDVNRAIPNRSVSIQSPIVDDGGGSD